MANKYITLIAGIFTEIAGLVTSAGATNAGAIPALDANGLLDLSLMPTGIGPDTATIPVSEALAAGALVNLWLSAGTVKARNADNTVAGKEAWGFVLTAAPSGNALVYFSGEITGLTLTGASQYFLGTGGGVTLTPPTAAASIVQSVGIASDTGTLAFVRGTPVTLA